jgi:hypothetical protein
MQREKERIMRTLLFAAAATAAFAAATPASAQFYAGAGPGGVGVEVGPFAVGVGPRYGWRDPAYYDYGPAECRVIKQRIQTPSGNWIMRSHRVCD